MCYRRLGEEEPGAASAGASSGLTGCGGGEDENQVGAWVVGEQWLQQGQERGDGVGVEKQMVLTPGWKELWRPGNYAGPQRRIAERAARDVGQSGGGVRGDPLALGWLEVSDGVSG